MAGFRLFTLFAAFLFISTTLSGTASATEIVDDFNQTISLEKPAKRIIPLYGAFTEMLFAIGSGAEVIARTQADEHPEGIRELPSVGTHMKPNVEMIIGLKPDLVIQSASRHEANPEMDRLRQAGCPVAVFAPKSFEDIFSVMLRLGALAGRVEQAEATVAQLKKRLENVKMKLADVRKRPRVFYEVRSEPLTGAGRGSIVQEILLAAGAENILENNKAIVHYSFEALLAGDPDGYIVQRGPMNRNPLDPSRRSHFERLRSVKEGKIFFVDELLFSRPGPRCVDAVEELAAALHPDKEIKK